MKAAVKGICGALLVTALLVPAAARANDDFNNPTPIGVNGLYVRDLSGAGFQTDEPLTPLGDGICDVGAEMDHTQWFEFTAPGGPTVLTTEGSNFDTQIALYDPPAPATFDNYLGCANDRAAGDPIAEGTFDATAGHTYLLQVGACDNDNKFGACPSESAGRSGTAWLAVLTNDDRAHPETLGTGSGTRTNAGATTDGTEPTSCGSAEYDKTVWFRYVAPAEGDVTFSTSSFDTVIAAYNGATKVACNDDAGDSNSSEIKFHAPKAGAYLLQVGGKSDPDGIFFGGFTYRLAFAEDFDHDNDGYNRRPVGSDCNDNNPSIHPNAPSIVGNGVDENCDGSDPPAPIPPADADGDHSPAGQDCDDHDPARTPGKTEIRGNAIDEDCDGTAEDYLEVKAHRGEADYSAGASTVFHSLLVKQIQKGDTVTITCRGKGCRTKRIVKKFNRGKRSYNFGAKLRRSHLRPGAVLEVRVTHPQRIGHAWRYKMRFFTRPKLTEDLCVRPGARKATACS